MRKTYKEASLGLAISVSVMALGGIIGNQADNVFIGVLDRFDYRLLNYEIQLLWATVVVSVITAVYTLILSHYKRAHDLASKLIRSDDLFIQLLTSGDRDAIGQTMNDFIASIYQLLNQQIGNGKCGITIYTPDSVDPDYLSAWKSVGQLWEKGDKLFYIGSDDSRRKSIRSSVFVTQELQVVEFVQSSIVPMDGNVNLIAQTNDYIDVSAKSYSTKEHRSFVAVPLRGRGGGSVGVLVIFSSSQNAFQTESICELVSSLGLRVALLLGRERELN